MLLHNSYSWIFESKKDIKQFNPYCWLTNCDENVETQKERYIFISNPFCWFSECVEEKKKVVNPFCWFTDCQDNSEKHFWLTDEQIINWSKEKLKNIQCWFKECSSSPPKQKDVVLSISDKLKNILNAAKPQEPVIEKFFKSEWSPYCWMSECCNQDSIPADIKSRLYNFNSLRCSCIPTKLCKMILVNLTVLLNTNNLYIFTFRRHFL